MSTYSNSNLGKMNHDNFGLHLKDWKRFLGLQLATKVLVEKNTTIEQLWSKKSGHTIFETLWLVTNTKRF